MCTSHSKLFCIQASFLTLWNFETLKGIWTTAFLISFTSYSLPNKPNVNFDASSEALVKTFYADHYLRETPALQTSPAPKVFVNFIKNEKFEHFLNQLFAQFCDTEGTSWATSLQYLVYRRSWLPKKTYPCSWLLFIS